MVGRPYEYTPDSGLSVLNQFSLGEMRDIFFGEPNQPRNLTGPADEMSTEVRTREFAAMWEGENPRIRRVIQRVIGMDEMWITMFFPLYQSTNPLKGIQVSKLIFDDHRLDRLPDFGTVGLTSQRWESWTIQPDRFGLGFMMEGGFAMKPIGIEMYGHSVMQIANALRDEIALTAFFHLGSVQGRSGLPNSEIVGVPMNATIEDMFVCETTRWACLVKSKTGIHDMIRYSEDQLQLRAPVTKSNQKGTCIILPHNSLITMKGANVNNGLYEYIRTGDEGVKAYRNLLNPTPLAATSGYQLFESGIYPIGRDGGMVDPLLSHRMIGEFFRAEHELSASNASPEAYRTALRNVNVYDEDKDSVGTIPLRVGLHYSGLFNRKTGELTDYGIEFFSGHGTTIAQYMKRRFDITGINYYGKFLSHVEAKLRKKMLNVSQNAPHSEEIRFLRQCLGLPVAADPAGGIGFDNKDDEEGGAGSGVIQRSINRSMNQGSGAAPLTYGSGNAAAAAPTQGRHDRDRFYPLEVEMHEYDSTGISVMGEKVMKSPKTPTEIARVLGGNPSSQDFVVTIDYIKRANATPDDSKDAKDQQQWVEALRKVYSTPVGVRRLANLANVPDGQTIAKQFTAALYPRGNKYTNMTFGVHRLTVLRSTDEARVKAALAQAKAYPDLERVVPDIYASLELTFPDMGVQIRSLCSYLNTLYADFPSKTSASLKKFLRKVAQATDVQAFLVLLGPDSLKNLRSLAEDPTDDDAVARADRLFNPDNDNPTPAFQQKQGEALNFPINMQFFDRCIDYDLPVFIDFTYVRPFMQYVMGNAFVLDKNVGVTFIGNPLFELSRDGAHTILYGKFSVELGAAVVQPERVVQMQNVIPKSYVSGGGTKFFDPSDEALRDAFVQRGEVNKCSMFSIPRLPGERSLGMYCDLTGFFPLSSDSNKPVTSVMQSFGDNRPHMHMAPEFARFWQLPSNPSYFENGRGTVRLGNGSRVTRWNTALCQGRQSSPTVTGHTLDPIGYKIPGRGHWGANNAYNNCKNHRIGLEGGLIPFEAQDERSKPTFTVDGQ